MKKMKIFNTAKSFQAWVDTLEPSDAAEYPTLISGVSLPFVQADATFYCAKPITAVKRFEKMFAPYGLRGWLPEDREGLEYFRFKDGADYFQQNEPEQFHWGVQYVGDECESAYYVWLGVNADLIKED